MQFGLKCPGSGEALVWSFHTFNNMSLGSELDLCSEEAFTEQFPVHRACRDGDVASLLSVLQRLSDHGHLSTEDSRYGWTPLHWAAHYGQVILLPTNVTHSLNVFKLWCMALCGENISQFGSN